MLIKIAKDGSLLEKQISKTSGIKELDESVLKAANMTQIEPLPIEIEDESVEIEMVFRYFEAYSSYQK